MSTEAQVPEARTLSAPSIERVAFKVPPFIPTDPDLWFFLLETCFDTARITQDATKFGHALSALEPKYTIEIRDVLLKPKPKRTYILFKTELVRRLWTS